MRILVTGGTGFVGRNVAGELRRRGHEVVLLARNPKSPRVAGFARQHQAELRRGDVTDASSLADVCTAIDGVIHLVGIISETRRQTYETVHIEGTQYILKAASRAGIRKFVHMSALGTRPDACARYHQSKWAAEELVRSSGLDWTIFRPSIIYGPGDGFVNLFALISRWSPVVPVMGKGETRFQPIPVEAVARAFASALESPQTARTTFDLCGAETLTLEQVIDAILKVTKRKRLKLHIPFPLAKIQARLMELMFGAIGKAPPLNRDQLLMLQEDNTGDGQPAAALFGFALPTFESGIRRYLRA